MSTPATTTATATRKPRTTARERALQADQAKATTPPQAPAPAPATTPPPASPAKPAKPAPLGQGIKPAKRKIAATDTAAKSAYVIKCVAAPKLPPKHSETPEQYVQSHLYRLVESDKPIKGWTPGKPFDVHHAGNGIHLGQYVIVAKKDVPAGKLITWTA